MGTDDQFVLRHNLQSGSIRSVVTKETPFLVHRHLSKRKEQIQFMFCDDETCGVNPFEFCKVLKKELKYKNIVFLLIKDSPTEKYIAKAKKSQIDEIVPSTFDYRKLQNRMNFLRKYKLDRRPKSGRKAKTQHYGASAIKRVFDVTLATIALVLLSPVLLLTMIAIRLESRGPVFYASKRVGAGYKIFDFYKFRSMNVDADQKIDAVKDKNQYAESSEKEVPASSSCPACLTNGKLCSPLLYIDGEEICERQHSLVRKAQKAGTFIKVKDDPRVTKVGKFIRNTSIDELPQLINVLKGDMSIVGNRPLPLYEAEQLTSDHWLTRFLAPAGITGLWQVEKRGGGTMSERERKLLDNTYARKYGFVKDIGLIFRTIPALFQSENV